MRGCSVLTRPSMISGKPVYVGDLDHRHAGVAQRLGRAAGRQDLDAALGEEAAELGEPGLVGNGDERAADRIGHRRRRPLFVEEGPGR